MIKRLDEFVIGETDQIKKVDGEGRLRKRLFDMGVTPGTEVYLRKKAPLGDPIEITTSDKIDKVLTNRWAGIPIFLAILFAIFHLTFSENFLYLGGLFKNVSPSFEGSMFEGILWTDAGISSPGVILFNLIECLTGGLGDLVGGMLSSSPLWVQSFISDGVLGGIFAVLSFVPQILLLFLFFSILEDSGYMVVLPLS